MNTAVLECAEQEQDETVYGCVSFLSMRGDITLVWDEQNRDKILSVIKKKMEEGYTFFTTKKLVLTNIERKTKVTKKNINTIEKIIITDEQFDKMIEDMDDRDLATIVRADSARFAKRDKRVPIETLERADTAEQVVKGKSVALRKVVGG